MSRAHVRDFHDDDLDAIVRLWERAYDRGTPPVYSLAEVIASCQADYALVATEEDEVIGAVVGRAAHAQGWIVFFGLGNNAGSELGGQLLDALERRMAPLGLAKLSILTSLKDEAASALTDNGFEVHNPLRYLERGMPVQRRELDKLRELGGRILPRRLWESVSGMQQEKTMLEERLITPLAQPDLADQFGVVPPRAVMLFGPPGTGKTTFAKAVASRLDWPFIELFPSRLAASPGGLPNAFRTSFEAVAEFEHAVVFIDEVEEVASQRRGDPPSPTQGVTNELLKQVAEFRDREGLLLICATNFIRALDSAFLRHGRFDYLIPIGLPDTEARIAIWKRYVPNSVSAQIDFDALAEASEGMTPADLEYAARRASQEALARTLNGNHPHRPEHELTTTSYLNALSVTRATVSPLDIDAFDEDIETYARL